jgi:hypothetical protein
VNESLLLVENSALEVAWPECSQEFQMALQDVLDTVRGVYEEVMFAKTPLPDNLILVEMVHEERTKFPCHAIGEVDQHFHGRLEALAQIKSHFNHCQALGKLGLFTIYGMGGVGKSSLALAFGNSCKDTN